VCRSTPLPGRDGSVLFVDASERFVKQGPRNVMLNDDVEAVVSAYRTAQDPDSDGGVAVGLASVEEIAANAWDLNPGRYIVRLSAPPLDLDVALTEYYELREELRAAEEVLDERLTEAGLHA
jgi:type I restriction enzyme M protein